MPVPLRALPVPRLPVLSWRYFLDRRACPLPAVTDAGPALPTTSGRAAIAIALKALGCGPWQRVLVPTYHCPTMVAPIVALGGQPVFYPINADGCAKLDVLEQLLKDGATAVIVPHYFGLPRPMRAIRALCDRYRAALIEDCAHAFFGRVDGRGIGEWGDFAIASLTKFFPVTEGGCLIQHQVAARRVSLGRRSHSVNLKVAVDALELGVMHHRLAGLNVLLGGLVRAKHRRKGEPTQAHLTPVEPVDLHTATARAEADFAEHALPFRKIAAVAWRIVKAGGTGRIVARRQANFNRLAEQLSQLKGARPLVMKAGEDAAPYVFPLWVDDPERVYQAVRRSGVPVFRWDDRWPGTPELIDDAGGEWSRHIFQIGCHQDLSSAELAWIAQTLKQIIDEGAAPCAGC
ncbi:DegT/DnrJ/EryC1/StrS family aminotransferase [Niveibacterium sp.]|uniref:DegT/DnrJ/EryC1/StrS family aminotransferase n=1 Tax=Niveibacterium sp. TaxID=2017444 RepID=UPI0035B1F75F